MKFRAQYRVSIENNLYLFKVEKKLKKLNRQFMSTAGRNWFYSGWICVFFNNF